MPQPRLWIAVLSLLLGGFATTASGATLFNGQDSGATPGSPLPQSQAAESSFDAVAGTLGTVQKIDFESLPVNVPTFSSNLSLGSGVSAELSGAWVPTSTGISNDVGNASHGFNSTPGGSKYLKLTLDGTLGTSATVSFQFSQPIQAFGAYLGGIGTGGCSQVTVQFNDGTAEELGLASQGASGGGMQFFGFVSPGAAISTVTFVESSINGNFVGDSYSVDDLRYVTQAAGSCIRDQQTACLVNGRFEVKVSYHTASASGAGQVMSFGGLRAESDESVFLWFFSPTNYELGLKILNACSINNRFWVFIAGLTNQGWTVHIRDTQGTATATYSNPVGQVTKTTADTSTTLKCP
jgi:hypothetical protein